MKSKLKNLLIPFILMVIINLMSFYFYDSRTFGVGLNPHVGILFIGGLFFGPYGAIGATVGNLICDFIRGYNVNSVFLSTIASFGVSYLAYKLWYDKYYSKTTELTTPRLNNTAHIIKFLIIIFICATLYSIFIGKTLFIFYIDSAHENMLIMIRYFINFVNFSFIMGIIGLWISKKVDFIHVPKMVKRPSHKKLYNITSVLIIISTIIIIIFDFHPVIYVPDWMKLLEVVFLLILIYIYLTKPIKSKVHQINYNSIPEKIMNIFLLTTLLIVIFGTTLGTDIIEVEEHTSLMLLILADIFMLIFFIPSLGVLKYVEMKVINPIMSFAKIEDHIKKNETIYSDDLIDIYSKYKDEDTEIGMLSRSYINLINYNNKYIEDIKTIESEKQRIEAELSIAHRIQESNLPTESIDNDFYSVSGFSRPAKEVGGDFYDYYELDDGRLVIVIGDASGKGVPAALLATITQKLIKQLILDENDVSEVLFSLNNQLCENNSEMMFITLWLGIYDKNSHKLVYSNGGHNPPLICENGEFKFLDIDSGLVLGILKDNVFKNEEIILDDELFLYTDGITDAQNTEEVLYGEDRLVNFFNKNQIDDGVIDKLLSNIDAFVGNEEQADDMTVLNLKIKK